MAYYILKSYKLKIAPSEIFEAFSVHKYCFFLDTSLVDYSKGLGRYSILGIDPFFILKARRDAPFEKIRNEINKYKIVEKSPALPFLGGAVGFFAYDLGLALEKKVRVAEKPDLGIPDCFFAFYNTSLIIDHSKELLYIFASGFPEKKEHLARLLARLNFTKVCKLISGISYGGSRPAVSQRFERRAWSCSDDGGSFSAKSRFIPDVLIKRGRELADGADLTSDFSREGYISAIRKAKNYIKNGDIYQVNLSQQFKGETSLSGVEIYKRLRGISPSNFGAYLDGIDFQICSSSPERFLKVEGDLVTTRPMKGTRPRGRNKREDIMLKKELLSSRKDKAELTMIVDLERNDLGKVCAYNSIKVGMMREIEEYSTVFQTTATVTGRLHKEKDRIDLLQACFPGGSITGCPKIRAMEIIEELEPVRRSIYTGALGYLSFSGRMEFNILIRSILKKGKELFFGAGGGIVADSNPAEEYDETMVKARAMIESVAVDVSDGK